MEMELRTKNVTKLNLLPYKEYIGDPRFNPIRFYSWPVVGSLYRRRVELCLSECTGGIRVLEVGFGSGITFLNLHDLYEEIHGLDLSIEVEKVAEIFRSRQIETYLQNGDVLNMPYPDNMFDTVILISILEHLKPYQQLLAFQEIRRVLKIGGQAIYGVPIERPLMVFMFLMLGYNIRKHHFSTEKDVSEAANCILEQRKIVRMRTVLGQVYEVGHFIKL
jgi:ubiquinone/menaquinone biosynthesis C-methylase UbiE